MNRELVISCTALAQLAAGGSEHLALFARATKEVCTSCKAECDKHAAHHKPCADCAESCAACIKECEAHIA